MLRRILGAGLLLSAALLTTGCACHKCGRSSVASAPPCCPAPPPPCCPTPGGTIPPPPAGFSNYAPPIVSIPGH
jgi:hypothetical protein